MDSYLLTARRKLRVTQEKMASLLGISRNYLAQLETGRKPASPRLDDLAARLVNNMSTPDVDWKERALAAEAKLEALKRAFHEILGQL